MFKAFVWEWPGGSVVKNLPVDAGDTGDSSSIHGWERSPGGGNGNPLQYSCLENPMERGTWLATIHGVTGVGHDLVTKPRALKVKVAQSCLTLCDPEDYMVH